MSKHQAIKTIKRELDRINREIDWKIIHGLSYIRESRQHKFLVSQLNRLGYYGGNWLARSLNVLSTFIF